MIIYEKFGKLKRKVAEINMGEGFKRVAFDGRKVYVCGEACKAFYLNGTLAWVAPVSFKGNAWTWLG